MRRFDQVTPEEMPEVVRVASRLFEEERAATQEQQSTIKAASELDLPPEYLERAAERVHTDRVAQIHQHRRRRNSLLATAGVVAVLGGGWVVTHPKSPAPVVLGFEQSPQISWGLNKDSASRAELTFPQEAGHGAVAQIQVDQFGSAPDGKYRVNLDTNNVPKTLNGYKTFTFQVRGTGLSSIRVALENGNERSRSRILPVSPTWQTFRLPLSQFDHQTGTEDNRRTDGTGPPRAVQRLSFKLGAQVNDPGQQGTVAIDDIRFE